MKLPKRLRQWTLESCSKCGAKKGKPCKNYKGQRKATCFVRIGCPTCHAQVGRCRHAARVRIQRSLFGQDVGYALPVDGYAERWVASRPGKLHL